MNMPNPVQKYIIMPNEIDAERPFIANNIKATLDAYKLAQVDVRDFRYGLSVDQQRMYYGMQGYPWAVAPKQAGEMDYPKGDRNVMADYTGEGGIPIGSVLKQLLFASYFKDRDLFFSTRFNANSRILIRRNVMERVRYLVPYLKLDRSPYAVATSSGVFWILDAYTTSRWYPAAAPYDHDGMTFNYIRNSVKIAVDAFNGNVDFYLEDPTDPIARAYQRIYPGLLKDKSQMPAELRQHIRYPKDIFDIQMNIYAKYHQTDPDVFYEQEDLWTFAKTQAAKKPVKLTPIYLTLDLVTPNKLDFLVMLPMLPQDRDNLRALAIGGCDGENYGKLIVYLFPKGELVYGPAQIEALINQDPAIAQQFTLWDQAGSSVVRGKMIILPIGNSVLFIQPVYLKSTSRVKIPELQRIIMSNGQFVVMETSLDKAYDLINRREAEERERVGKGLPLLNPAGENTAVAKPVERKDNAASN